MKRLCAFDIETDRKGGHLISAGWAIYTTDPEHPETGHCIAKEVGDLIEQIGLADIVVGHNIIDSDTPFLLEHFPATMQAAVTSKDIIDTLYLSPIAFPHNPYHHLYKDYKPFPLAPNDSVEDSLESVQLLWAEERALTDCPPEVRSVLLTLLGHCSRTSAVTAQVRGMMETLTQEQVLAAITLALLTLPPQRE